MKRLLTSMAAVGALVALTAAPAAAQEDLGFEIDTDEGSPGDVVNGQVNTDDVAQHCNANAEELQPKFTETALAYFDLAEFYFGVPFDPPPSELTFEGYEQFAFLATAIVAEGVGNDLALAEQAFPQTFIMTFADIATQEPVGDMGNFDPATGEGSVVVPDIDPGFWGVAAACVSPSVDPEFLQGAVSANTPAVQEFIETDPNLIEEWEQAFGIPFEFPMTVQADIAIFAIALGVAAPLGEELVPALMTPDALGAQIFCILDETGECPDDGLPPGPPADDDEAPPAEAVVVQPDFTG